MSQLRPVIVLVVALMQVPAGVAAEPQILVRSTAPDGRVVLELLPPGSGLVRTSLDGKRFRTQVLDPRAPLRVIVEFDAVPEAIARLHGLDLAAPRASLDRLRGDLARIVPVARETNASGPAWTITHEYSRVFAGAAVTLPPASLEALRRLPYVRSVSPDDSVRASLFQSVSQIGADRVRNQLGADGTGIRVGILDTGIDYTHPAFGGGFGPGSRVVGGWDSVNGDPDPRDDHGHGTHVAGIVGGNGGGIVGVAPGATLYAFKVLDQDGNGYDSWILDALERVLDPDGDPLTNDALQVINMSFGGAGGSDDPLAVAVDHLVEAGVVCVAAAGNGFLPFTVGSPGTAHDAITVGACTRGDQVEAFSSRGPVLGSLDLKPDLVAPGSAIVSAAMGGGVVAMSGTSMAAPHVAGVAAQLRQRYPAWSPSQVKQALVGTAVDLFRPAFEQGAGRVDAWAAANVEFTVSPTSLAFGRTDGRSGTWTRRDTLVVTNLTGTTRTVDFPAREIATGAQVVFAPSQVVLSPAGSATVVAALDVDETLSPFPAEAPFGYAGMVVANSDADTRRLPVSFHRAAALEVQAVGPGFMTGWIVHEPRAGGAAFGDFYGNRILLPPGTYDFVGSFWPIPRYVVKEGIPVAGETVFVFDSADADRVQSFADVGPDGTPLDCNGGTVQLSHFSSLWSTGALGFPIPEIRTSTMSSAYRLEWSRYANGPNTRVAVPGGLDGVTNSQTFANDPSALHHVALHVPVPAGAPAIPAFYDYGYAAALDLEYAFAPIDVEHPVTESFTIDLWMAPASREGHVQRAWSLDLYPPADAAGWDASRPLLAGPRIRLDQGWPFPTWYEKFTTTRWGAIAEPDVYYQRGMPVWRGRLLRQENTLVLGSGNDGYAAQHLVADMNGATRFEPDPAFRLDDGTQVVRNGVLQGLGAYSSMGPTHVATVAPGRYRLQTSHPYTLRGIPATLDVAATIDTRTTDVDVPSLRVLQLLVDGVATDTIPNTARSARLRFRITDDGALATPAAWYRPGTTGGWRPLTVRTENGDFVADLPAVDRSPVGIRLLAEDAAGNSLEFLWDAAFTAASGPRIPGGPDGAPVFALRGASPNPTSSAGLTVDFSLATAGDARLALYDVTGRRVIDRDLADLAPGPHRLALASDSSLRAGIYFLRLTQGTQSSTKKVCITGP